MPSMDDATPVRRILVINPNSSDAVTRAIDAALTPLRLPGGPEIAVTGLAEGPRGIATQTDADGVIAPLQAMLCADPADAFVLACFSDPGLYSLREVARGRPVMGIAEWGLLRALSLGEAFGIIALAEPSIRRQQRIVRLMGLQSRYVRSRAIAATAEDTTGNEAFTRLHAAGERLREDGADVIVLGCAGMATHRRGLEAALGVPVVEPTQAAVTAAIGAVLLMDA